MSSAGLSEISGVQDLDIIQRFEEACEFGSGAQRFVWKLQPESTMLITLHWVFDVRLISLLYQGTVTYNRAVESI